MPLVSEGKSLTTKLRALCLDVNYIVYTYEAPDILGVHKNKNYALFTVQKLQMFLNSAGMAL